MKQSPHNTDDTHNLFSTRLYLPHSDNALLFSREHTEYRIALWFPFLDWTQLNNQIFYKCRKWGSQTMYILDWQGVCANNLFKILLCPLQWKLWNRMLWFIVCIINTFMWKHKYFYKINLMLYNIKCS